MLCAQVNYKIELAVLLPRQGGLGVFDKTL